MQQTVLETISNRRIARNTYELVLAGDTAAVARPGQFVNLKLEGFSLRRPLSVCDCDPGLLTLVYKTVGRGTAALAALPAGARIDTLTGLGNGFSTERSGEAPLLVGGGAGVAPLYWLARRLREEGRDVQAVLGFNTAEEIFYEDRFRSLGVETAVATADGSRGVRGFVTDALPPDGAYSYVYSCGPGPMMRAVCGRIAADGEFSFEERMGCGFGACMGCSCETKRGARRICRDGPVFKKEEILW